jgi:photosystem II stability/assembly factor-like uncharacterized protein
MRDTWLFALIMAACLAPASARAQELQYKTHGDADTAFAQLRSRLEHLKYHEDAVDAPNRWMVVEPPGYKTKVEIRIDAVRDSATVTIKSLDVNDMVSALRAEGIVASDASADPETSGRPTAAGELPPSRWRPEMFLSPLGRLWIARSGLFTTDSLGGSWRPSFDPQRAGIDGQSVSIGTTMAFVDEDTTFMGLRDAFDGKAHPRLYRSTDAGKSWSTVPTGRIGGVDAIEAVGGSVWAFATYFDHEARRTAFLRSADGGVTWTRASLPPDLRDVTHVYRLTSTVAYLATLGDSARPAFWWTGDTGATWRSIPTPRDQKVNDVPELGTRIERIATVGTWLVVREYGAVFVTRSDSIRWRRLPDLGDIAADRERDQLFALTKSHQPEMLDAQLKVIWQCRDKIAPPDDIEGVLARDGVGYVWMSGGTIYEARDGTLRDRQPRP